VHGCFSIISGLIFLLSLRCNLRIQDLIRKNTKIPNHNWEQQTRKIPELRIKPETSGPSTNLRSPLGHHLFTLLVASDNGKCCSFSALSCIQAKAVTVPIGLCWSYCMQFICSAMMDQNHRFLSATEIFLVWHLCGFCEATGLDTCIAPAMV